MNSIVAEYIKYGELRSDPVSKILGIDQIDYYSGGSIEQAEKKIENLTRVIEKLVSILVINSVISESDLADMSRFHYLNGEKFTLLLVKEEIHEDEETMRHD